MKPRVAILIPSVGVGGVEHVMTHLATGLQENGVDSELLTLNDFSPSSPVLQVSGTAMRLTHHLKTGGYSGLISAKERANVVAAMARKALGRRVKTIVTRHVPLSGAGRDSRWVVPHLYKRIYRHVDAMVGVSEDIAKQLRDTVGPSVSAKVHALVNPVIGPEFQTHANAAVADAWLTDTRKCVLTVGRLVPQKGLSLMVRALTVTPPDVRPRWLIIGDGLERRKLEKQIRRANLSADVRFIGAIDNPLPWMAAADALALPSLYEGLPTVLIEALTLGTPCVAMNCPTGPSQIATHGGRLVLVNQRSPEAFRDGLLAALHPTGKVEPFDSSPFHVNNATRAYLNLLGIT